MNHHDKPRVAILGAGIAGLSIAWRLAQGGARVDLFDKWHAGHAASWAAAGMLAPGAGLLIGDDQFQALALGSRKLWPDFAGEIEDEGRGPVGFTPSGSLILSWSDAEATRLKAQCKAGSSAEWLSSAAACELEPALDKRIKGAAFLPDDAHVNNRWLIERLVTACVHRDVRLHEGIEDAGLAFAGDTLVGIKSDSLVLSADAVVIAAGAWSSLVNGIPLAARIPIRPVKGQMIAVSPALKTLHHIVWSDETYLVPRSGLPLAIGATLEEKGFDTTINDDAKETLLTAGKRAAGDAIGDVVDAWAGLRPAAPDGLPVLGRSSIANLIYATGQFRNGILLAPSIAEAVAHLLLKNEWDRTLDAFSPQRFAAA